MDACDKARCSFFFSVFLLSVLLQLTAIEHSLSLSLLLARSLFCILLINVFPLHQVMKIGKRHAHVCIYVQIRR